MEILIFSPRMPAASRAYMLQYITLVLKVLTFFIAIFASQKLADKGKGTEEGFGGKGAISSAMPETEKRREYLSSIIREAGLFDKPDSSSLNIDVSYGLSEVLRNHDLNAELTVFSGGDIRIGLEKAASLQAYFKESAGIPEKAVTVLVSSEETGRVQVRFAQDRGEDAG